MNLPEHLSFDEKVKIFNEENDTLYKWLRIYHTALNLQIVEVDDTQGKDYNTNNVAPPEMNLMQVSLKKNGLTMPVVGCDTPEASKPYTVVDGFHRTTVARKNKEIRESLHGQLPVSKLDKGIEDRITSTVRHNMARGSHQVELSAKLVVLLKKHNWSNARIGKELGMDADEVLRLKQITGLAEAYKERDFSKRWEDVDG